MLLTGTVNISTLDLLGQLLWLALMFALVVALTVVCTRWIANARYRRGSTGNLQVVESIAVGQQVYLQLVRVGGKYVVVGVTKSNVSFLCHIAEEDVKSSQDSPSGIGLGRFENYLKSAFSKEQPKNDDDTN